MYMRFCLAEIKNIYLLQLEKTMRATKVGPENNINPNNII